MTSTRAMTSRRERLMSQFVGGLRRSAAGRRVVASADGRTRPATSIDHGHGLQGGFQVEVEGCGVGCIYIHIHIHTFIYIYIYIYIYIMGCTASPRRVQQVMDADRQPALITNIDGRTAALQRSTALPPPLSPRRLSLLDCSSSSSLSSTALCDNQLLARLACDTDIGLQWILFGLDRDQSVN
jgi:hypothetical protein